MYAMGTIISDDQKFNNQILAYFTNLLSTSTFFFKFILSLYYPEDRIIAMHSH